MNCKTTESMYSVFPYPANADFILTQPTVMFLSGDGSGTIRCITFILFDDTILEGSEMFDVTITDAGPATLGANTQATVTIQDNDGDKLNSVCHNCVTNYLFLWACYYYNLIGGFVK